MNVMNHDCNLIHIIFSFVLVYQVEMHFPDGVKEIVFPDSTRKIINPDGMQVCF